VILAVGAVSLVAGLLAWLVRAHYAGRRYFDRPALARNRLFDPLILLLQWTFLLGGMFLLGRSSWIVALSAAAGLIVLWGYRRAIRSAAFQRRLLRREFEALRTDRPDLPERALLHQIVMRRHPQWGEELIEQMVLDYPTIEDLARMICRMERGFRGFR
jgi:hypothetical protein